MWGFPHASIHYCKWTLHPRSCLDKLWLILESGSILHGTPYLANVCWGLNWLGPSVWPVSIHRTVQKHGTQPTDVDGMWFSGGRTWSRHRILSHLYSHINMLCGFQGGSKNSRSVKSVLVWGLHPHPISPNDTVTHPRKPEYSANHATRASNLVTKEMTVYWYFNIH
jgi:hypothetical protein